MDIETLTVFLCWATIINIGILLFSSFMVVAFKNTVSSIHMKMFFMSREDVFKAYFNYLANYKTLTIIFNLVPYLILELIM